MKKIKTIIAVSLLAVTTASMAQNLQSAYFTDGYLYRHELNPAFGSGHSYVSMPGLGNLNVSTEGNVGAKTFLYNVNGRTATFLHPNVTTQEFLDNLKDKNKLNETLKLQILGAGFKAFGGYNTIEVNVREQVGVTAPGSLFRAMKEGLQNTTYDFSDLHSSGDAYAEVALGHSRQINDKLRVGAKVKVLLGLANEELKVNSAHLVLGEDSYKAAVDAEMSVSAKDIVFKHDVNDNTGHRYVSGIDDSSFGIAGMGFGVDLGAEYKLDDEWTFSAAVLDLGFINYGKSFVASTGGMKTFDTDRYIFNVDDDAANSFSKQWDNIQDDLSALYELDDKGDQGSKSRMLATTVNVGAKYTLPAYKKLNFGLLLTSRINGKYSASEARLSANVAPIKQFSAGVNVSAGTYGMGFGWVADFHTSGFGLFVGMDRLLGSLSKQGVPLGSNTNVALGINFPF